MLDWHGMLSFVVPWVLGVWFGWHLKRFVLALQRRKLEKLLERLRVEISTGYERGTMSAIDKAIKLMCATCGNDLCNGNCWDVGGMRIIIAEAQIEALENFITNSISLGELRNSIKNMESVIDAEKANALANEMNRLRKAAVRGE